MLCGFACAQTVIVGELEAPKEWTAAASDGVVAGVSAGKGMTGEALRLDFDFQKGSGFCVARRKLPVDLPPNFAITLDVKGEGPPNNFEFKLIDETGDNVWWVNQRGFEFPKEWKRTSLKRRHFQFAWGPGGAEKGLKRLSAIEIAVAAGNGGKGSLWLDSLTITALPEATAVAAGGEVRASSRSVAELPPPALPEDGVVKWAWKPEDAMPRLEVVFSAPREFGGLSLDWTGKAPLAYAVDLMDAGTREWRPALKIDESDGDADHVPMPESEALGVRIRVTAKPMVGGSLERLRIRDLEFGRSLNSFVRSCAAEAPEGRFPRAFGGEQVYWTIVGAPGDEREVLLGEDGAVEIDKGSCSIEPFLRIGNRTIAWPDAAISHTLDQGSLPIPTVMWSTPEVELEITALAAGDAADRRIVVMYTVRNAGANTVFGSLALALRPFQVLPPTQDLNIVGGVSRIDDLSCDAHGFTVGARRVLFSRHPDGVGVSAFAAGEAAERLVQGRNPGGPSAHDPLGLASGFASFAFELGAGAETGVALVIPFAEGASDELGAGTDPLADLGAARAEWSERLSRVRFRLPGAAAELEDIFRSQVAYILINRDGAAIQPGSRSYERTWIRDGALTSTALLYAGHSEEVREFLNWFAPFQYESGKVPCCVDRRGADPVPENDSHGEYIYAVAEYFRFTQDRAFLRRHAAHVKMAVEYIDRLRAERMTDRYRAGAGIERAKYGLLPESISHEGYSAKPMHSYWDDFWAWRGLNDGAFIANALGDAELAQRSRASSVEFGAAVAASVRLAIQEKTINFIPGCVELGDFDATSTSIALFPTGARALLPERELAQTFARYERWFTDRAAGRLDWKDYTPYEIRNATSFLLLGKRDAAHAMLEFFLKDQRPQGWNHWAEVVRRGERTPGFIGDMPHTWVGSDYIKLVRTMFVHETYEGGLVIGLGLPRAWCEAPGGVAAENLPTWFGPISYQAMQRGAETTLQFLGDVRPARGIEVALDAAASAKEILADGAPVTRQPSGKLVLSKLPRTLILRD